MSGRGPADPRDRGESDPQVRRQTDPPGRTPLDLAGVAVCALCAVLAAFLTVLLTPLYWGSVIMPLSVLLAIAANVALPVMARMLGASPLVAALPFVLWLVTVIALGTSRPEGDVLLPAGSGAQPWVTYGMLAAGALAGGVTVARMTMGRPPSDDAAEPLPTRPAATRGRR